MMEKMLTGNGRREKKGRVTNGNKREKAIPSISEELFRGERRETGNCTPR